jgi:hypothetical protein
MTRIRRPSSRDGQNQQKPPPLIVVRSWELSLDTRNSPEERATPVQEVSMSLPDGVIVVTGALNLPFNKNFGQPPTTTSNEMDFVITLECEAQKSIDN